MMTKSFNGADQTGLPIDLASSRATPLAPENLPADIRELLEKPGRMLYGDIDIRIDAKGVWYHEGGRISRHKLVKLFSRVLKRDDSGDFWMVTPAEVARIRVEDAPFIAVEMMVEDEEEDRTIRFRTNVDDEITLDAEHPLRVEIDPDNGEPRPYVVVRDRLEALLTRPVFYQLVDEGSELEIDGELILGVWSAGVFFPLGATGEAAA